MTIEQWEAKYKDNRVRMKSGDIMLDVGADREDPRRLDAMRISDYSVRFFRSKWATLERVFNYQQGFYGDY